MRNDTPTKTERYQRIREIITLCRYCAYKDELSFVWSEMNMLEKLVFFIFFPILVPIYLMVTWLQNAK